MDQNQLLDKLQELLNLPHETECVEFKERKTDTKFDKIGQYFSALSNEANLKDKSCGWLVFGVNNQKEVVGTNFKENRTSLNN